MASLALNFLLIEFSQRAMNYNRGSRSIPLSKRPVMPSGQSNAGILRGECLCRAVGYAVTDTFEYALNCHCSNCRRATGSAFKPFAGIARDRLQLVKGDRDLLIYGEVSETSPHDVHCRRCGSLLWSVVRDGAYVHVAMGTLTDPPSIRPAAHIFVGSKATWHEINDDLPQYVGHVTQDRNSKET